MPLGQGVTSKAAFKIENTAWGTSTDCGAGDQIHFISESISHAIEQAQAIHKDGNVGAKNLYPIFKKYGGDMLIEAHYAGMESLIATAMGMSHQDLSPVAVTSMTYKHYFEPSEDLSTRTFNGYEMVTPSGNASRRGSLCLEKDVSVWELASSMCNAMNFEAGPERITFSFTLAGKTIEFDSATNPDSSAWTLPSNTEQIAWEDMTIYIKARDEFTITAANDKFVIDDGGGDIELDIADGTYTGYELAQLIARAANDHVDVDGIYKMEYDEHRRRFRIYSINAQTFSVSGTIGTLSETIGMTIDSVTAIETESNFDAIPDAFAAFGSDDQIGISKITFAQENALEIESQDSESDLYILEPERNGERRVTGTIEIPRYKNDTWLDAVNGFTTYMLWINFIGSEIDSENYEFNIHMPAIKFTNADAPITGAELIKQTLAFEAELPDIVDFVNFAFPAYNFRNTANTTSFGMDLEPYVDGLYVGLTDGEVDKWDGNSFSLSSDLGVPDVSTLKQFDSNLYAGLDDGSIFEFDGVNWTTNTDFGIGGIIDMEVYNNQLFAIENNTGKIFVSNAPVATDSWSLSCDTTATDMERLRVYGGNLYAIGSDGSTFTKVYKYDGGGAPTDWSISCDFRSGSSVMSMAVHRGKLYITAGTSLYSFNGTTWVTEDATLGISVKDMVSFKGNLMLLESSGGEDLYYFDFGSAAPVNIFSTLNLTAPNKMQVYQGNLFMAHQSAPLKMFIPPKEIMITIQNQNSVNPL